MNAWTFAARWCVSFDPACLALTLTRTRWQMLFSRLPIWAAMITNAPTYEEGGEPDFDYETKLKELRGCAPSPYSPGTRLTLCECLQATQGALLGRLGTLESCCSCRVDQG